MRTKAKKARPYSERQTRLLIRKALPPEIRPPGLILKELKGGHNALVRSLPSWVRRFGILSGPGQCFLWCDPLSTPGDAFPSQIIIDIPRGRHIVNTFDTNARTWVSRESAEGGPLVVGLPFTGNPVLAWIRAVKP